MQYFFIPGRHFDLSLAELKAVFAMYEDTKVTIDGKNYDFILVNTYLSELTVGAIFKRLGGFTKYGELVKTEDPAFLEGLVASKPKKYAVSLYGEWEPEKLRKTATALNNDLKKYFTDFGIRTRYVGQGETIVTTGTIVGTRLLETGFELVVMRNARGEVFSGKTLEVQDIEDYTLRDFGKPTTDTEMGVLPPKLARIMINLAGVQKNGTIWDPFCGSGVILMEALLLGYNVLGSDVSDAAIDASRENVAWLGERYNIGDLKYNIFTHDITDVDKRLDKRLLLSNIDAIVFEPYMGPPQTDRMHPGKADKLIENTTKLLKKAFETFERAGKKEVVVVAVVPSYLTFKGWRDMTYMKFLSKKWKILNKNGSQPLQWKRSNSIITRNILISQLIRI